MRSDALRSELRRQDTRCAAEPITVPGGVQSQGILLAVDPAEPFRLVAASANAERLVSGGEPLNLDLGSILGEDFVGQLRQAVDQDLLRPAAPWEIALELDGTQWDVVSHEHAGLVLIELIPAAPTDALAALAATRLLQRALAGLRGSEADLTELGFVTVRNIRQLTGYERVLVYRFDEDWNGQAVAEDMVPDYPAPLLGLHFPESDIPAQARALYRTSLIRVTESRDASTAPLRARPGWNQPIDLSYARLRSMSPVHLQYHRNLGVDGSMSISIMDGSRLWGLVVCHHRTPHRVTGAQRAAALALTDAFALRIRPAQLAGMEEARRAEQAHYSALIGQLAADDDLQSALTAGPVTLLDLFKAPGAAVVRGDNVTTLGMVPPAAEIASLAGWLRAEAPAGDVYCTLGLALAMPGWKHVDVASGLLAVFLDGDRTDMLLWFRPEEPQQVSWGGNPTKQPDARGIVLPRRSFERWVEERRGLAEPWAPHEVEIATLLRHAITDVILSNVRRVAALSDQLRQSQKMEAVGQLTGGLAHDFNNLLGGIISSLELGRMRITQGRTGDLDRYFAAALGAASRAASLTHRLLAFSRRQTLDPRPVDANRLIASMEDLIRRTMGPGVQLDVVMAAGLWSILCDANQLENALLNLSLNARDAMPSGGRLTIEATNVRMDDAVAAGYDMSPGHYVGISVSDTGTGMTPEVAARVFEPFYTTKPLGRGTGLGLSMVYGFTRQSGGETRIYSEPGQGTTIRMYLPRNVGATPVEEDAPKPLVAAPTGASILVVDDEPVLRAMVCEALTDAGFTVSEAANAPDALAWLSALPAMPAAVDLLLTDVGLPGMNGRELAEAARARDPELRVLFITGYAENAALAGGLLGPQTQVLTKPFNIEVLVEKVRTMTEGLR